MSSHAKLFVAPSSPVAPGRGFFNGLLADFKNYGFPGGFYVPEGVAPLTSVMVANNMVGEIISMTYDVPGLVLQNNASTPAPGNGWANLDVALRCGP